MLKPSASTSIVSASWRHEGPPLRGRGLRGALEITICLARSWLTTSTFVVDRQSCWGLDLYKSGLQEIHFIFI